MFKATEMQMCISRLMMPAVRRWLGKQLMETACIDAPTLMGFMVPLLLYADDLNLVSTSAAGLRKHLDALASFCEQRQLTVNLSN